MRASRGGLQARSHVDGRCAHRRGERTREQRRLEGEVARLDVEAVRGVVDMWPWNRRRGRERLGQWKENPGD